MPAPGQDPNTDDVLAALYAYGGGAPGQDPSALSPVPGPLSAPTPSALPSAAPSPVDPYTGPAQTQANALINPTTGNPEPVQLPPTRGTQPNYPGVAGPDTMSQGEKPQNPYGPAPAPGKPMSALDAAQQSVDQAVQAGGESKATAEIAKNQAQGAQLERRAQVGIDSVNAQARADNAYLMAQQANNAQADQETAQWMQDMEKKSKEEPNPHRYFDNTSSFGKALWFLSFAFGAKAQAHGAVQNAALAMFDAEVNADVARQRDRLGRELQALKDKGAIMDKRHERNAKIIGDAHAMKVQRLLSLQNALDMRAQKPGAEDDVAALAQAKDWVNGKMVEVAADKNKYVREAKQKELDRSAENWRAQQHIAQADRVNQENIRNHNMENQRAYDLADEKLAMKLAEQSGKQDAFHKSLVPIPVQSGAYLKNSKGEKIQLQVRGEDAQKVQQEIATAQQEASSLADLKDAITDSGFMDRVFGNDTDRRKALAQVVDPLVKRMGGRFNKDTVNTLNSYILGEDTNSAWQRLSGADKEHMAQMVQEEIDKLPLKTKENLRSYPSNLADNPDADFGFDFKSQRAPKQGEISGDKAYGTQHAHLTDSASIDQLGKDVTAALPDDLKSSVTATLSEFENKKPGYATNRGVQALADLRKYAKAHPDQAAEVDDAEKLIARGMQEAEATAQDNWAGLIGGLRAQATTGEITASDVKDMAKKAGLGSLPTKDIEDLLKEFNTDRSFINKHRF